jgi:hypothetical protein
MLKKMSGKTFSNLLDYYIACLHQEDMLSVTFNVSSEGTAFVSTLFQTEVLFHTNNKQVSIQNADEVKKFFQTSFLQQRNKTLFYAYPVVIGPQGTISPLFFTEIQCQQHDSQMILTKPSENRTLNHYILLQQNFSEEEIQNIKQEIEEEDFPSALSSIGEILHLSTKECTQTLDEKPFKRTIEPKLLNKAILYFGERTEITHNLLIELSQLKNKPVDELASTALFLLLTGHYPLKKTTQEHKPLLEIFALNQAQENAVHQSLQNPLTVITGPPGTGKSQVVLNIIANAVSHHKTILFASKNNKAVDVVIQKLNVLLPYNLLVRMGHQGHRKNAKAQLELLATQPIQKIQPQHNTKDDLLAIASQIEKIQHQITALCALNESIESTQKTLDCLQQHLPDDSPSQELLGNLEHIDPVLLQEELTKLFNTDTILHHLLAERQRRKQEQCFRTYYDTLPSPLKTYLQNRRSNNNATSQQALEWILQWKKQQLAFHQLRQMKTTAATTPTYIELKNHLTTLHKHYIAISQKLLQQQWVNTFAEASDQEKQHISSYFSSLEQRNISQGGQSLFRRLHTQRVRSLQTILKFLPVWVVTNLSAKQSFPLKNNIFYILIIDEASQCDIVSALPLFYRARHVVIIGDPYQLKHISLLTETQDRDLARVHDVPEEIFNEFSYTKHSLYDLAEKIKQKNNQQPVLLNEHYRCHPDIISFSNEYYYDRRLTIATDETRLLHHPHLQTRFLWHHVKGKTAHAKSPYNEQEAEQVAEEALRLLDVVSSSHASLGIVTLFRAQTEIITEKLQKFQDLFSHEITVGTAHRFQGDEKDIILFSPAISEGAKPGTLQWIQTTNQLLNVAVTRAKSLFIIVGDHEACRHTTGPLKHLTDHAETTQANKSRIVSPTKQILYEELTKQGVPIHPNYVIQGPTPVLVDFALFVNGKRYAIEIRENHTKTQTKRSMDNTWKTRWFSEQEVQTKLADVVEEIKRMC